MKRVKYNEHPIFDNRDIVQYLISFLPLLDIIVLIRAYSTLPINEVDITQERIARVLLKYTNDSVLVSLLCTPQDEAQAIYTGSIILEALYDIDMDCHDIDIFASSMLPILDGLPTEPRRHRHLSYGTCDNIQDIVDIRLPYSNTKIQHITVADPLAAISKFDFEFCRNGYIPGQPLIIHDLNSLITKRISIDMEDRFLDYFRDYFRKDTTMLVYVLEARIQKYRRRGFIIDIKSCPEKLSPTHGFGIESWNLFIRDWTAFIDKVK